MSAHDSCREHLKQVMNDVRKYVSVEDRRKAWFHGVRGLSSLEFYGPNRFYWYGGGCCKWQARTYGWIAYLKHIGITEV